mmetsp:Transcript_21229/g.31474  ORF Transcript_21229/g.31474 Transcript_21229/m.31474 type:complete len:249 (-) Transcript_21229:96-842(-)
MRLLLILFIISNNVFGLSIDAKPSNKMMVSRRSLVFAASTAMATTLVPKPAVAATTTVSDGMSAFASGDVEKSIAIYDVILSSSPQYKPYLWQRGLSLYYADRFQDGADQFAADVAVNPNDTEEQIWHLLCLAQVKGKSLDAARPFKLTVGRDRRPVMRAVQSLFLSGKDEDEDKLIQIAQQEGGGNQFYAALYLSLYYESMGETGQAQKWMVQAVKTNYSQQTGVRDPMVELAKVALKRRGWSNTKV